MIRFNPGQLRLARRNNKLKLIDVANHLLFKTPASVANRENGLTSTTADDLAAFADLYNVPVQYFFYEKI